LDKVPVSDQCEELELQPTAFYRWQKEFFENRKLEQARHRRQLRRTAESLADFSNTTTMTSPGETEAGSAGMHPC